MVPWCHADHDNENETLQNQYRVQSTEYCVQVITSHLTLTPCTLHLTPYNSHSLQTGSKVTLALTVTNTLETRSHAGPPRV